MRSKIITFAILTLLVTSILISLSGSNRARAEVGYGGFPENKCLSFDGIDDYVTCGAPDVEAYRARTMTIELWIKPKYTIENGSNVLYGQTLGILVSYTETWANQGGWVLYFDFSDGRLCFRYRYTYTDPYTGQPYYITGTASTNRAIWQSSSWYHIAVTYTFSSLVFYVNRTIDVIYDNVKSLYYKGASLKIGGDLANGYMFAGLIDEVRYWNVSRTQNEVIESWNRILYPTECVQLELIGYWRFDEGSGDTSIDYSIQGNDAILGLSPFNPAWVDQGAPIIYEEPPWNWRENIEVGDILVDMYSGWDKEKGLRKIAVEGHAGIYVGNGEVVEACLLPVPSRVRKTSIETWDYPSRTDVYICRVSTSLVNRAQAALFAEDQVGSWYQPKLNDKRPDSSLWYCSELPWAAYYNQGINIDSSDTPSMSEEEIFGNPVLPRELLYDDDITVVGKHEEGAIRGDINFVVDCPVNLIVTDPDGLTVSEDLFEIPGAVYIVDDVDEDGDKEEGICILERKIGSYLVTVVPEPDASPTDTYNFEVFTGNSMILLAENVSVSDIPSEPYVVESMDTGVGRMVTFNAVWDGMNYLIAVSSNSTVTQFIFNQSSTQICFAVSGETATIGYCNVTIPKALLKGNPWTIKINNMPIDFIQTENATHSSLCFAYTYESTLQITIQGTWVIPEFPTAFILPFMTITLIAVKVHRGKRTPKPYQTIF